MRFGWIGLRKDAVRVFCSAVIRCGQISVSQQPKFFGMQPPPERIGDLPVVFYTPIDARHTPTSATRHWSGGELLGPAAGLAVCAADGGFYLFGCDADWEPVTDTWHDSVEDAKEQAEFEYVGTATTWRPAG